LRCAGCGRSYPRDPLPRMLTEEYSELLGRRSQMGSESARWGIEDVAYWEAEYADSDEQARVRERIARSRPDAGLRTLPREQHIFRHFRPHLKGKILLDIGCGNAQTVQVLCHPDEVGYTYVGVDLSLSALVMNQRTFPGLFVQASATALPFEPETFDAILMLGTLHHLYDPRATLRQILKLLKPGGLIGLHEVTYRRSHHAVESTHNEEVPLEAILATLGESCEIVDLKEEHSAVTQLLGGTLAEQMRTSPALTKVVLAMDALAGKLRYLHRALGPRAALIAARKV
jgi:SAM-dependent methyltransferase